MGSDDVEPQTDAWFPAAMSVLEQGGVPLGWVTEGAHGFNGTFGRDFCRVVICRREWWQDVPEIHYWSDNAFDVLMRATGHEPTIAPGFDFNHRRSMIGRDESPERLDRDREAYQQWTRSSSSTAATASPTYVNWSDGSSGPVTNGSSS
jgi:hypothetical protein